MPKIRDDATKKVLVATIGKANLILQQEYYNYKAKASSIDCQAPSSPATSGSHALKEIRLRGRQRSTWHGMTSMQSRNT